MIQFRGVSTLQRRFCASGKEQNFADRALPDHLIKEFGAPLIPNAVSRKSQLRINLLQKCQKTLSGAVDLEKG